MRSMSLCDLLNIPRIGNCIENSSGLSTLSDLAAEVWESPEDPLEFCAPSIPSAVAWLLCLGHWFASDWITTLGFQSRLDRTTGLLNFRGQKAHYGNLTATLCRKAPPDRNYYHNALNWMKLLIEVWHDRHFEYLVKTEEGQSFWPGYEEAEAVSQHYGVPTELLDWTVDPLVALCFACGDLLTQEHGVVIVGTRDWRPMTGWQPLPPPTFVSRLWRQRGLFTRCYCGFENGDKPYAEYVRLRILEGSDETVRASYKRLIADPEHLEPIASWAQATARVADPPAWLASFQSEIPEVIEKRFGIALPNGLLSNGPTFREDVQAMAEVVDLMALRSHAGEFKYDLRALCHFFEALYRDSSLRRSPEIALGTQDARGPVFAPVAAQPDFYLAVGSDHGLDYLPLSGRPPTCSSPLTDPIHGQT